MLKKPWADGTAALDLDPLVFIARLASLVPQPGRHMTRCFGILSSHAACPKKIATAMRLPYEVPGLLPPRPRTGEESASHRPRPLPSQDEQGDDGEQEWQN